MKIKSSFRDYYDGLKASDMESEPLYIRNTSLEFTSKEIIPNSAHRIGGTNDGAPECFALGFCGSIYYGIKVTSYIDRVDYVLRHSYYYAAEPYLVSLKSPPDKYKEKWIREWFNGAITDWSGLKTTSFYKLLTPYFSYGPIWVAEAAKPNSDKVIVNPRLASWDFARIVPPYQAWRDLYVYLSNLANPNPTIPAISNADMIVAKGFNHPDSFRAIKGESGPARKRKKK